MLCWAPGASSLAEPNEWLALARERATRVVASRAVLSAHSLSRVVNIGPILFSCSISSPSRYYYHRPVAVLSRPHRHGEPVCYGDLAQWWCSHHCLCSVPILQVVEFPLLGPRRRRCQLRDRNLGAPQFLGLGMLARHHGYSRCSSQLLFTRSMPIRLDERL